MYVETQHGELLDGSPSSLLDGCPSSLLDCYPSSCLAAVRQGVKSAVGRHFRDGSLMHRTGFERMRNGQQIERYMSKTKNAVLAVREASLDVKPERQAGRQAGSQSGRQAERQAGSQADFKLDVIARRACIRPCSSLSARQVVRCDVSSSMVRVNQ